MKRNFLTPFLFLFLLMVGVRAHAGTVTYVYTDPQGTPLAEADSDGNVKATYDYHPYGAQALGGKPNGPGYTGHVSDADSGLVYMQARYYDPTTGRFISVDPLEPNAGAFSNFSRYVYARNNPLAYTDPSGMQDCSAACEKMRQLSDWFSSVTRGFSGGYQQASGPMAQSQVMVAYVKEGVSGDLASAAGGIAPAADLVPGATAIACSMSECSSFVWAAAIAGVIPAEALEVGLAKQAGAYSVAFEAVIPRLGVGTRASHFRDANTMLLSAMQRDKSLAEAIDQLGVRIGRLDKSPADWSWHHVPDRPGVMQLVPREQHQGGAWQSLLHPGRQGGFKLWGSDF